MLKQIPISIKTFLAGSSSLFVETPKIFYFICLKKLPMLINALGCFGPLTRGASNSKLIGCFLFKTKDLDDVFSILLGAIKLLTSFTAKFERKPALGTLETDNGGALAKSC